MRCGRILVLLAGMALAGCASNELRRTSATPIWVPASQPQIASVDNSAYYAFAAEPGYDTLVFEEDYSRSGTVRHRLVWIVGLPTQSVYNRRLEIDGNEVFGWLLEELPGRQTHAVPLEGTITLRNKDADHVTTTVDLRAPGAVPAAGETVRPYRVLAQKITWDRTMPYVHRYQEMTTTSGIPR